MLGDEPRNHVVGTGDNKEAVSSNAEILAKAFWDVRHEFAFVAPHDLETSFML